MKLTPAIAHQLVTADGRRGADSRVAKRYNVTRQHVNYLRNQHQRTLHRIPVTSTIVDIATRNTADTPIARPEPAQAATEPTVLPPVEIDPDDLVYRDPPFAYPRPLPRNDLCMSLRDSVIMSNPEPKAQAKVAAKQQATEFNHIVSLPVACTYDPVANARLAANLSIAAAWFLTALSYLMIHVDLRLVWLWLPTVGSLMLASASQRELRRRTIGA